MSWEVMMKQLEGILQAPLTRISIPLSEWQSRSDRTTKDHSVEPRSIEKGQHVYFRLDEPIEGMLQVFSADQAQITPTERRLVEMLLDLQGQGPIMGVQSHKTAAVNEDERKLSQLRDWLQQQLEAGVRKAELPEVLAASLGLFERRLPFLLYGDYSDTRQVNYGELKKLLEQFLEEDVILLPLSDKEWLILGSESLLTAGLEEGREEGEEESQEEALSSMCSALYEMLANEWVGEYHVTVHYPMTPANSLVSTVHSMRETMKLGRLFQLGSNYHFPWDMHMEKLLFSVPEEERLQFIEQVLRGIDHVLDAETLSTLEQFFALDCNVSETAKKLYIHRNTLLYRLDKFKQETGKDVRTFKDAVLVKTALLLYKVTKRK